MIARAFLRKLISYSTGATPTIADRGTVETVLDQCKDSDYGMRDLIVELAASELFVQK